MKAFLGVTLGANASERVRGPVAAAVACLTDAESPLERVDVDERGWLAFVGPDDRDELGPSGGAFTISLGRLLRTRDADLSTAELGALMSSPAQLSALVPPFAAVHRSHSGAPVLAATDWLGFRQLFWWCGDGAAAVSTSARALSVLAGGAFDPAGLGVQAMVGWQVGDRTPFAGVRALPAATLARLVDGGIELREYAPPLSQSGPAPQLDDAVHEMASILRDWQDRYLDAHPDTVLQLTGGIDSRILLGAIAPERRAGLRALTLGEAGHPDVAIAARLSDRYGLRHETRRLDEFHSTPAEAHARALVAARALEYQASPMALSPLLLVEAHLDQGDRFSGLGGEVARGFYYAGQPSGAVTSARRVERLADWRICANEAVEPAALNPEFHARARTDTLAALTAAFEPGDWLRATDAFYLYHRMQRWGGAHGSVAAVRRRAVNPMFDRRFIELALAVAPNDKKDSGLLGRLMSELDRELADIPLDSGLVPSRLGARTVSARVAIRAATVRRMVRKAYQRMSHGRRPQLGAASAADLVVAHWRASRSACEPLYDMPMLDQVWLAGLVQGEHTAEPTTVAFLVNLLAASSPP